MSNNIYDTANQLERELRDLPAFLALKESYKAIKDDEAASKLFTEMRELSGKIQEGQMMGQAPSEEDMERVQELAKLSSENELINSLMGHEQQLSVVIQDINRIITNPLNELYSE